MRGHSGRCEGALVDRPSERLVPAKGFEREQQPDQSHRAAAQSERRRRARSGNRRGEQRSECVRWMQRAAEGRASAHRARPTMAHLLLQVSV